MRSSRSAKAAKLTVTLYYSIEGAEFCKRAKACNGSENSETRNGSECAGTRGAPVGFDVSGHAGYAEYGSDIVCSAVSALTQAAAMGLGEYLSAVGELYIKEGEMRLTLKGGLAHGEALQAKAILETMRLGLIGIRDEYPGYIEIVEKTVEGSK